MIFERNDGQTDSRARFISRGDGYLLFITPTDAILKLRRSGSDRRGDGRPGQEQKAQILDIQLIGANPNAQIIAQEKVAARSNYFIGSDPSKWRTNVPSFSSVRSKGIYPGIDLIYYGSSRHQLEYDFVVRPKAEPGAIAMRFEGANGLSLNRNGDLIISLPDGGELIHRAPMIYQEREGKREAVRGGFVLNSRDTVGVKLAAYDHERSLYIDPGLVYSTYLGGTAEDSGNGIAVDSFGNAYIVGTTFSTMFPTTTGAYKETSPDPGNAVAFITKFKADGSDLVYSTFLGGTFGSRGNAIAVDSFGSAYVTGETISNDFPTTMGAYITNVGTFEVDDAFVTKLKPDGSGLVYSSYLGGNHALHSSGASDMGFGIALDSNDDAYVTGATDSSDFPTTMGAFETSLPFFPSAFVTKFKADGSGVFYSTFLGEIVAGFFNGIAVDSSGNAYVAQTTASGCPATMGAYKTMPLGQFDGCLSKLSADGTGLVYSTYFGGSQSELVYAVAVDATKHAYVTGSTASTDYPTTAGAFQTSSAGGHSAFVTKFKDDGTDLVYSTYLGGGAAGSGDDTGFAIVLNSADEAYVTGDFSFTFPTTPGAFMRIKPGEPPVLNGFVSKLASDGSSLVYSTYLGGEATDQGFGIAVDSIGNAYVTGQTASANFPTTGGAYKTTAPGGKDAFVSKLDLTPVPTDTPTASATATATQTASATPIHTATATSTATGSATRTPTATQTPTATLRATPTATTTSTRTATPTPTPIGPSPRLSVSTKPINLSAKPGKSKSKTLKVKNVGKGTLHVLGTAGLSPPLSSSGSGTVRPKKSLKIKVTDSPTTGGSTVTQTLKILSDDPSHPEVDISVTGTSP